MQLYIPCIRAKTVALITKYFCSLDQRRRRSSLAQLTDIIREWSGSGIKRSQKPQLNRRETLADLARSLPWRSNTVDNNQSTQPIKKRRESTIDFSSKSLRARREQDSTETSKNPHKRENMSDKCENTFNEANPAVVS